MLRATLKSLLSRKLRLVLSGLAVVLAVMSVSGSFVLSDTLGRTFEQMFTSVYDYTDIQVQAKPKVASDQGPPVVPPTEHDVVERVAAIPGVSKATGQVFEQGAVVVNKKGKALASTGSPRFGASWIGEDELVKMREGREPAAAGEIVINASLAKAGNFKVGETIGILTPFQREKTSFTLVGIFGYTGGRDSIGGAQVVAFTEPVAQQLMLGRTGVYSLIDVKVDDRGMMSNVRDDLRTELGAAYAVETGKDLAKKNADDVKQGLSFITYILLGFAGVSLLVGGFLIVNTFSIIVAQRTQELALLRAMGASRRQVITSVLIEAMLVALVAWMFGLVLGVGLGTAGAYLLTSLGNGGLEVANVGVPAEALLVSLVVALGVTVLAALLPAFQAARVPPVAAMRVAAAPDRPLTSLTIAGALLSAGAGGLLWYGLSGRASGNTLWYVLAGILVAFIAVALLTPLLGKPVVSLLGFAFAWSVPGNLGRRNSARNPRRTAITAAAMMIGIALVTGVSTIFESASTSISKITDRQLQADLIIAGPPVVALPPTVAPEVLARVRALSSVDTVAAYGYDFTSEVDGKRNQVIMSFDDLAAGTRVLQLKPKDGQLKTLAPGEIVASDKVAESNGWQVGEEISVQLPRVDAKPYRLVGTYVDNEVMTGVAGVISWSDAQAGFTVIGAAEAYVQVKPGADVAAAKRDIDEILTDSPEHNVLTREEYVGQATQFFDLALKIVQVLLIVAMIIAVLGIINTLFLSVFERTRELGLLRAIGLPRTRVIGMITVESVVLSVFGALLGVGVGAGLGTAVVRALKDQGFTELTLPWALMAQYLIIGALVGVVAAILPAIWAARLNVLNAISYE